MHATLHDVLITRGTTHKAAQGYSVYYWNDCWHLERCSSLSFPSQLRETRMFTASACQKGLTIRGYDGARTRNLSDANRALSRWATYPRSFVDQEGIEPSISRMPCKRSPVEPWTHVVDTEGIEPSISRMRTERSPVEPRTQEDSAINA